MARSQTPAANAPIAAIPPDTRSELAGGPPTTGGPRSGAKLTTNRGGSPLLGSTARKRRPVWVLVGVVLVGISALLGAYILRSASEQIRVTVAARDLSPGQPVTEADLQVVEIARSTGFRAIQPSQQELILGRSPRGPIPRLTVLNTDLFVARGQSPIPPGQAVVGAALDPGAAPAPSLRAGDPVDIIVAQKSNGADNAAPVARKIGSGVVWAVDRPDSASSSTAKFWVSVLVPAELQAEVGQAAFDGTLRLSLTGGVSP